MRKPRVGNGLTRFSGNEIFLTAPLSPPETGLLKNPPPRRHRVVPEIFVIPSRCGSVGTVNQTGAAYVNLCKMFIDVLMCEIVELYMMCCGMTYEFYFVVGTRRVRNQVFVGAVLGECNGS